MSKASIKKVVTTIGVAKKMKVETTGINTSVEATTSNSAQMTTSAVFSLTGANLGVSLAMNNNVTLAHNIDYKFKPKKKTAAAPDESKFATVFGVASMAKLPDVATSNFQTIYYPDLEVSKMTDITKNVVCKTNEYCAFLAANDISLNGNSEMRMIKPGLAKITNLVLSLGAFGTCAYFRNAKNFDFFKSDKIETDEKNNPKKVVKKLSFGNTSNLTNIAFIQKFEKDVKEFQATKATVDLDISDDDFFAQKYSYSKNNSGLTSCWTVKLNANVSLSFDGKTYSTRGCKVCLINKYLPGSDDKFEMSSLDNYLVNAVGIQLSDSNGKRALTINLSFKIASSGESLGIDSYLNLNNIVDTSVNLGLNSSLDEDPDPQKKIFITAKLSGGINSENIKFVRNDLELIPDDKKKADISLNPINLGICKFKSQCKPLIKTNFIEEEIKFNYVPIYDRNKKCFVNVKLIDDYLDCNNKINLSQLNCFKNQLLSANKLSYGISVSANDDPDSFKFNQALDLNEISITKKEIIITDKKKTEKKIIYSLNINDGKSISFNLENENFEKLVPTICTLTKSEGNTYYYWYVFVCYSEFYDKFVIQEMPIVNQTVYYALSQFKPGNNLSPSARKAVGVAAGSSALGLMTVTSLINLIYNKPNAINFVAQTGNLTLSAKAAHTDALTTNDKIEFKAKTSNVTLDKDGINLKTDSLLQIGTNLDKGKRKTLVEINGNTVSILVEGDTVATFKKNSAIIKYGKMVLDFKDNVFAVKSKGTLLEISDTKLSFFNKLNIDK